MPKELTLAEPADLEMALAHALQFDGRKAFKTSGEMMAKITAAHLAECLRRGGFVVMKKPPLEGHSTAGAMRARFETPGPEHNAATRKT